MDPEMMQKLMAAQRGAQEPEREQSPAEIAVLNSIKQISDISCVVAKYGAIPFILYYGLNMETPGMPGPGPSIWSLLPFM